MFYLPVQLNKAAIDVYVLTKKFHIEAKKSEILFHKSKESFSAMPGKRGLL